MNKNADQKIPTLLHNYIRTMTLILVVSMPQLAHATMFNVNQTNDLEDANQGDGVCATTAGTCTLRAAVQESNARPGLDTVNLRAERYVLTQGEIVIERNLRIIGQGPGTETRRGTIIDADRKSRVIRVESPGFAPEVRISGVTIQNGAASFTQFSSTPIGRGGGIFVARDSTLSLHRTVVANNGAIEFGGAIFVDAGTLNVFTSTITGNSGPSRGGGGIANFFGTVTLTGSTVDNNRAAGGGFTGGGGVENLGGRVMISNSTISGNRLTGGVSSRGGGIENRQGATLNLRNVTIANNVVVPKPDTFRFGGGISNDAASTVNMINTIVDDNSAPMGSDCFGVLMSGGFNLIGNITNCQIVGDRTGNILGGDALLLPLADNGGETQTHRLFFNSPAVDPVGNATCSPADQRGFVRHGTCDIGALEEGAAIPVCGASEATIIGTDRNDFLTGTAGADVMHSLGGNDRILALDGNDIACGGLGEDFVNGGFGDDRLFGGPGNDVLLGTGGRDTLNGGLGDDTCDGANSTGETTTSCEVVH